MVKAWRLVRLSFQVLIPKNPTNMGKVSAVCQKFGKMYNWYDGSHKIDDLGFNSDNSSDFENNLPKSL